VVHAFVVDLLDDGIAGGIILGGLRAGGSRTYESSRNGGDGCNEEV
jgi:hypothetical protein